MSDDRNKFQIAGLFPPWERSSFGSSPKTNSEGVFRRAVVSPPDQKRGMMQRQAARLADDDGQQATAFSSSSPFFKSRRTFFLLYLVNRLKIVLTLTLYPFSRQILPFFIFFLLTLLAKFFPRTLIFSILTPRSFSFFSIALPTSAIATRRALTNEKLQLRPQKNFQPPRNVSNKKIFRAR